MHTCTWYTQPISKHICTDTLIIFTNPSARAGYDTRSIFKRSLTGFEFRVFLKNLAGGRIIGFIPFLRVLVLSEMQSVSSRIWTRVAVSIFYDDNHYTTGTCTDTLILTCIYIHLLYNFMNTNSYRHTCVHAYALLHLIICSSCPVTKGCRVCRLLFCRGVRLLSECPRYHTKQSDGEVPVMLELLGNVEYPFITIAPSFTLAQSGSTWWGPIYQSNRTKLNFC